MANPVYGNALDMIGNTPLIAVRRLDTGPCQLFLKLESQNPGGSIKDRIGLYLIEAAERAGFDFPGPLGGLDEIEPDSVLNRAARILALELQEQLAGAGVEAPHGDQRRVADHVQRVAVNGIRHARASGAP